MQRQLAQETGERASDIKPNRSGSVQTQDAIPTPRVGIRSLAVLPFTNAGDDPEMEYLSDGLTENILFGMSQLSEVQVLAKSAVFRHKGSDSGDAAMGIVVLQERRGVDEHIKDVAARLANNRIRHRELLTSNAPL